jgi:mannitol-1-phosphate 5-dehydrogenase
VIFVDIDPIVIAAMNEKKSYRLVIKAEQEKEILVRNVRAVSCLDVNTVAEELSRVSIMAVCVGKNALEKIIPTIAKGLMLRYEKNPLLTIDVIIAENMRSAGDFLRKKLSACLPSTYPIDKLLGTVETSIGKMVPIMPQSEMEKDPLLVYAEQYNSLILDRKGFLGVIPNVDGLCPKENIKAWVDRKAFIHNMGHATVAYYGYFKHPKAKYIYEVLEDSQVYNFAREVMLQSAEILHVIYPSDFSFKDLENHIDDLLFRFQNRALQDTIFRVGQDLPRKLSVDDRFVGIIRLAIENKMSYDKILEAMTFGLFFKATDDNGNMAAPDIKFYEMLSSDFEGTIMRICGINNNLYKEIYNKYKILSN